jgi:hypothetical protein
MSHLPPLVMKRWMVKLAFHPRWGPLLLKRRVEASLRADVTTLISVKKMRTRLGQKGDFTDRTVKVGRKSGSVDADPSKARHASWSVPTCPSSQQKGPIIVRQQSGRYAPDPTPCLIALPLLTFFLLRCHGTTHTRPVSGPREASSWMTTL